MRRLLRGRNQIRPAIYCKDVAASTTSVGRELFAKEFVVVVGNSD